MQLVRRLSTPLRAASLLGMGAAFLLATGCAAKVDRFTIDRVLGEGSTHSDVQRVCATGDALGIALEGLTRGNANRALVMADTSAAMCAEFEVREAQLEAARARATLSGPSMVSAVKDSRLREERARATAAYRFWRSWEHLQARYGTVGGDSCPRISDRDQIVYLLGLYGGLAAMIHDNAGAGELGVPQSVLGQVARGTECIDNARWWHVPGAFRTAAWATLANTEHGDPWALLDAEAAAGEASGVRLARAVQVMIGANAGRNDVLEAGILAHAASLEQTPTSQEWAIFDQYGLLVGRHESDLLWTAAEGHRTPAYGALPGAEEPELPADPFGSGGDPFGDGADPFGDNPLPDDADDDEQPDADDVESPPEPLEE